jgi:hypothetical protein
MAFWPVGSTAGASRAEGRAVYWRPEQVGWCRQGLWRRLGVAAPEGWEGPWSGQLGLCRPRLGGQGRLADAKRG